ncbi:MAG: hypothetical protein ACYTG7_14310 [Planctomycetota bacterium]|jgi:hypothetical protein
MSPSSSDHLLNEVFEKIVKPFVLGMGGGAGPMPTPRETLDALDRIEDFTLAGSDVAASELLKDQAGLLEILLRSEDRIEKRGRRLLFHIQNARSLDLPGMPFKGSIEESFSLDFRLATDPFGDPDVEERKQKALRSKAQDLKQIPSENVLIAAVLPQKKRWTGLYTPIGVEFGIRLSLRFLIAAFFGDRIRLFAAGPTVLEIPI